MIESYELLLEYVLIVIFCDLLYENISIFKIK